MTLLTVIFNFKNIFFQFSEPRGALIREKERLEQENAKVHIVHKCSSHSLVISNSLT